MTVLKCMVYLMSAAASLFIIALATLLMTIDTAIKYG